MTTNAALVERFMTDCVMVEKKRVSDGLGGFVTEWTDGAEFRAAIVKDNSIEAKVAEKQGVTEVYTVTTAPGVGLDYHEVFRRVEDGQVFRVTSNHIDSSLPEAVGATFNLEQVSAEAWTLPAT